MPWKTCDSMDLKREFVELANRDGANIRELCRRFGISPPTGYKWLRRYRKDGAQGLFDRSCRPHRSPGVTHNEMVQLVLKGRQRHPAWGGRKLKRWLENKGHRCVPAASTITEILRRHDLLTRSDSPTGIGWKRFEKEQPNQLWQIDFKGWFSVMSGDRCYPLTMLDDHSRFNLLLEACRSETLREVRPLLERAFATYGLPTAILCDNGCPWGDSLGHYTAFEAWLLRLGVDVLHGRPCHPQTQGKEERFHRTLKAEVLGRTTAWRDMMQCAVSFKEWRTVYNHERPHEALGGEVPASRYTHSVRKAPARLPEAGQWYGGTDIIKRVKSKGEITFRNVFWSIGAAFRGEEIALRSSGEGRWDVYYCWKKIGVMDLASRSGKKKGRYEQLRERSVGRRTDD